MSRQFLLAVTVLLAQTGQGVGQLPVRQEGSGPLVVERDVRERWVQGGQHPGFVPFGRRQESIHVRVREAGGSLGGRYLDISSGRRGGYLRLDGRNRLRSMQVDPSRISLPGTRNPGQYDPWQRHLRALRDRVAGLWELAVVLPGEQLASGVTWTDTLSFSVEPSQEWLETLEGIWRHRVVGDTLVEGRLLPLVQTTAELRHRSLESVPDGGMEGHLLVERTLSGQMVGTAAVDTALGLRVTGTDSSAWEGTATLHTQDGRSFDTPLTYERVRRWQLSDSTEWALVQDSARAERRRRDTGMLAMPFGDLEERLAQGDLSLADSLRGVWLDTDDPDERPEVERLLRRWGGRATEGGEGMDAWLEEARIELGDTATVLAARLDGGSWLESLTSEELDELLPYLDDLGRLWEIGVAPRWTYSTLATGLLDDTPILQPDTAQWNCTPAACDRVISLLESASEPRLRDVALVMAFSRDPSAWYERLRARADSGSLVVQEALKLGNGLGMTSRTAPGEPLPPRGSSWRAWLAWMGGTIRFQSAHTNALRLYQARTGRDVVGELRSQWPMEGDSASAVLGTILREMGGLEPTTLETLAEELLSGSKARWRVAQDKLHTMVPPGRTRGETPDSLLAPPEVLAEVLPPLLDSLLTGGRSPWPGVGTEGEVEPSVRLGGRHGEEFPLFLLDENLPPDFIPDPSTGFQLIDGESWDARPRREGGVLLSLAPLTARGPFAALSWDFYTFYQREPDEAPGGYAGGGTVWLLRRDGGWVVVSVLIWIT